MTTVIRSASSGPNIATIRRLKREARERTVTLPDTTTEQGKREASVMLARLCGWLTKDSAFYNYSPPNGKGASVNHKRGYSAVDIFRPIPNGASCPTLYHPDNMALAWRVLNWAFDELPGNTGHRQEFWNFLHAEENLQQLHLWAMPPAEAQRAWLDEILKLSIEAGLVAAANESQ